MVGVGIPSIVLVGSRISVIHVLDYLEEILNYSFVLLHEGLNEGHQFIAHLFAHGVAGCKIIDGCKFPSFSFQSPLSPLARLHHLSQDGKTDCSNTNCNVPYWDFTYFSLELP